MKRILFYFILTVLSYRISAQNIIGGEITYTHISGFTFQINVNVYSFDSAVHEIASIWGDGTSDTLISSSAQGNNVYSSLFSGTHTFPGLGTYVMGITAKYLSSSITNINEPGSKIFYLEDTLRILDPAFSGYNNSPVLLNADYDLGIVGESFLYNPNAYDPDGDSLSFEMIPYFVGDYSFPPTSDSIIINPSTGLIDWEQPIESGNFLLAILVHEWRLDVVIGTLTNVLLVNITDTLVSVQEVIQDPMRIFPNPVITFIQINLPSNQPTTLSTFNLLGEKVKQDQVTGKQVTLDVSELPAGMYVVRSNETLIGKFVKE